jgi:putative hydrolase of the HAD superfamily
MGTPPPASEPRLIIFDLGGVLVRRDPERLVRTLGEAGCSPARIAQAVDDPALIDAFERGRLTESAFLERMNAALGLAWTREQFLHTWNGILDEEPEAAGLLATLRGRYRLAILSNTNAPHEAYIRRRWAYLDALDPWVASWRVGFRKPEPEIFRLVLSQAQVAAEQALFLDDLPEFVEAASRLGLRAVQRVTGASLAALLRGAGVAV